MKGEKKESIYYACWSLQRTRARKAVSAGNEPARETTVVSLSVDSESDDMSDVSSKSNKNEERNYGEDMDFGWDDRDYGRAEGKENSEKAKEDKENSESGEEKDVVSGGENSKDGEKENNEKGEEEKDQEPEKDKENKGLMRKAKNTWRNRWRKFSVKASGKKSKGTPTSTGVIVITPRGRTKAAAARKAISISPEIVVVTGIAELAEKEVEVEATQTEQEAIQTEIVEKEAEVTEKDVELAEKEDQDVDEEEEKAEESEDNPVESPAKKQTELAEKSVEVELKTKRKPKVKVIAVPYGIPRAERLAKMRAEAEKKKARAEKKKAKADGAPKKKGRPKKTEATLKPCTPPSEKRKSEPSRWVQSPFTEGKTDELEVPKKKLKTKT
ncbi:hypothetical protein Bca52824_080874 [Brassica carinata]|uniref:Uncharacterized protein n=1 Tax=Brassica carinata TaxID=52824 RepID=A0A8X7PGW5_BRACI|nr:hypothetical protein Bca52824_080874 [Brassica carinata]